MAETLFSLIENDLPEGKTNLINFSDKLDSILNYCNDNFNQSISKPIAFEESKNLIAQALSNVACQFNYMAVNFNQLVDMQLMLIKEMEVNVDNLSQRINIVKEKICRREIGQLTSNKNVPRHYKIISSKANDDPNLFKYIRKPIDFSILDNIGNCIMLRPIKESFIEDSFGSKQNIYDLNLSKGFTINRTNFLGGSIKNNINIMNSVGQKNLYNFSQLNLNHVERIGRGIENNAFFNPHGNHRDNTLSMKPNFEQFNHPQMTGLNNDLIKYKFAHPSFNENPDFFNPHRDPYKHQNFSNYSTNVDLYQPLSILNKGNIPPNYELTSPTSINTPSNLNDIKTAVAAQDMNSYGNYLYNDHLVPHTATHHENVTTLGGHYKNVHINNLGLEKVVALYDYTMEKSDELTFRENDVIQVIKKNEDGWWEGILLSNGKRGLFPGNYVESL